MGVSCYDCLGKQKPRVMCCGLVSSPDWRERGVTKHGGGMRVMPQEDGWNIWGGGIGFDKTPQWRTR